MFLALAYALTYLAIGITLYTAIGVLWIIYGDDVEPIDWNHDGGDILGIGAVFTLGWPLLTPLVAGGVLVHVVLT